MREKCKKQLPLMNPTIDHPQAKELEVISRILDQETTIGEMVHQDLCCSHWLKKTGACGMSAEQVLRAAIVKQMFGFSYDLLPFHLADSISLRAFCRIQPNWVTVIRKRQGNPAFAGQYAVDFHNGNQS